MREPRKKTKHSLLNFTPWKVECVDAEVHDLHPTLRAHQSGGDGHDAAVEEALQHSWTQIARDVKRGSSASQAHEWHLLPDGEEGHHIPPAIHPRDAPAPALVGAVSARRARPRFPGS